MPKGPVQTPITNQEISFAHLILAGTMTDRQAAKVAGIDPRRAAYVKGKPKVQAYMEEHRASVRAGLVQHEVEALAKFNISREQILAKWWEFGNLDPALGYNTSSQSKALELLWKGLGYADSEPQKAQETEPEPPRHSFYVAKWRRKPGDPDYEENEGETAAGVETSTRPESIMSDSEPLPRTPRPEVVPQSPAMGPNGNTIHRTVELTGPSRLKPGAGFGRFQGL